jgi:hypothetical protein
MKTNYPETKELEKQKTALWKALTNNDNCMFLNESEAMYLMKGQATDLIDLIHVKSLYNVNEIKIFGVQAADKTKGKYVWIYLYHRYRLIKCKNLMDAYDKVRLINENNELEIKIDKLEKKLKAQQKLLQVCDN